VGSISVYPIQLGWNCWAVAQKTGIPTEPVSSLPFCCRRSSLPFCCRRSRFILPPPLLALLLPPLPLHSTAAAPFPVAAGRRRPLPLPPLLPLLPLGFPFPCSRHRRWSLPLPVQLLPPPRRRCWSLPIPLQPALSPTQCRLQLCLSA
jgi:hypothetical protein